MVSAALSSTSSIKGQPQILAWSGNLQLNHSLGVVGFVYLAYCKFGQGSGSHFLSCNLAVVSWS